MTNIIIKLRDSIEDNYKYTPDPFEYITSKVFTLTEPNIDVTTLVCYKNGAAFLAVTSGPSPVTNWTYSAVTGKVTVITALVAGDILEFVYNAYAKYSDNELRGYIRAALGYLSVEKYKTFVAKSDNLIAPTPTEAEEYLIAFIAAVIIKGSIGSYKTPEISITFNDKMSKEEKIKQAIRQFSKSNGASVYAELDSETDISEDEDN